MAAGNLYIRKNTTDSSAVPNAGTNEDSGWDSVAKDVGGIVSYTDPNFRLGIGLYLIMYSEYFYTADVTNNERIEVQGEIHVSGTGAIGGYGQDYIRKSSGQQACIVSGYTILNVTSANTDIFVRFYRTDNSTTGTVNRVPGYGSVQILELDTAHNYGFYSASASEVTSGTTVRTLNINTNDRQDTGFTRTADIVTIANAGRYLATYSLDLSQAGTGRETVFGFLEKNSATPFVGSYSYCYLRGADGTQDGAITWIGIIDVAANDTIRLRYNCPTSQTITTAAGAKLQLWQIPAGADEFIAEATSGDYAAASTDFAWDTTAHIDTGSFSHVSGSADVDIAGQSFLLAFASCSQPTDSTVQRAYPFFRFNVNGAISDIATSGAYHRNSATSGFGLSVASIIADTPPNTVLSLRTGNLGASGALANTSGQLSVLNLESIWNYTYPPYISNVNTDNQIDLGQANNILAGGVFEATQNTGKLEICSNSDYSGTIVLQTINSWSDSSIDFDFVQGALLEGTKYCFVTNDSGDRNSVGLIVNIGDAPYSDIVDNLLPDHYWTLNNSWVDSGATGPQRDMTSGVIGTTGFDTTPLARSDTHSWYIDSIAARREIVDSPNMNITVISKERTVTTWVMLGGVQQALSAIWKEGGGIQNLAFIMGIGNVLTAQLADTAVTRDNVQAFSDFRLAPNRPYHICMRYSHLETVKEFRLYIDGIEQTNTDGNPMTLGIFDSHSGDVTWNDPDGNLETGGTDILYNGQDNCWLSNFNTWSDNSAGTTKGALAKISEIKEVLFEKGVLADVILARDTEVNMQIALDLLADTVRPDWPLAIKVNKTSDGTNLELIADNITFDLRVSLQIQWMGGVGDVLTWVNINGSVVDDTKFSTPNGGTINIVEAPSVAVQVKKASDKTVISGASVLLTVNSGGDLPYKEVVSITRVDTTATVSHVTHGFLTGQKILLSGSDQIEYNGIKSIIVTGNDTYTFSIVNTVATPATGTITVTHVVLEGVSDVAGEIKTNHRFTTNQPVIGIIRKATSPPYYISSIITGTILLNGLVLTGFLVED